MLWVDFLHRIDLLLPGEFHTGVVGHSLPDYEASSLLFLLHTFLEVRQSHLKMGCVFQFVDMSNQPILQEIFPPILSFRRFLEGMCPKSFGYLSCLLDALRNQLLHFF